MIVCSWLIVDCRVELDQPHNPGSIELEAKRINARSCQLSDEEILSVEPDAIQYVEDQCLHSSFKLRIWRISLDWPHSAPQNMIDGAEQVLEVFDKELLWIFSINGQWLHHTGHLTHIGL